ncbi:hypothetical protein ACU6VI_07710 [Sphaerotilus natans]|jgi:hypothetical protein|uniref:Biopolymer transporter ExbD n=1 Tax=Sphaerotilus sulfidivorans TaxID=639200 RepID=A0A5C1PYT6_9BURK|nr:hypothetical protein [Sphaerotilus sulfidivorans]MBP8175403.1 hypothetical protein [Sphaerotilus sp.]GIX54779.1 hypothetical protein CQA4T8M7_40350 [Sphaerotilus natans]MCK6404351.1 hypothetical protein [Sphaerotilus sulfidivorans]NZD44670.1 hypothetical protein [Sphaerotilus sulfidivorans]QEN00421.1 hypothetical protein EWH46_06265 [Sphaerotilus sulfidivorans]
MAVLRPRRTDEIDPFSDLLFNTLLIFVMLFTVALLAMNPKAKTGVIDAKAEFIVTVTWPDMNPNDIDTWIEDPGGNRVWFRQREGGMMHLDRDDRGLSNDSIVVNGQQVVNPLNQEVVTIRGFAPGEYVVNVFYYDSKDGQPVPVNVSVVKVNPRAEVVFYGTVNLPRKGDEATAVRFSVDRDGRVTGVNTLAKTLVERI